VWCVCGVVCGRRGRERERGKDWGEDGRGGLLFCECGLYIYFYIGAIRKKLEVFFLCGIFCAEKYGNVLFRLLNFGSLVL